MRTALKTAGILIVLYVTMLLVNGAFRLMSLPNDWAVLGGLGILLALLVFYIWAVPKVWKRMSSCIKQIGHPVLLLVVIGSLAMIGCTRIEPGHVGIIINNSGTYRGVEDVPMSTGWVWYNPFSSSVLNYPTYVQQAVWSANVHEGKAINEEIDFNSSDQMRFTADVAVGYSLQEKGVPHFYIKFRSDVLSTFTHGFFRNEARQALNAAADKFSSEEILSTKKDELLNTAREFLASRVTPYGVTIEQFTFTGAPRPPVELTASINAKVSAIQRAQQAENELREATAQAAKAVAKAKGESEANRLLSESLTPTLLEWRKLQITEQAIAKWNGARPMVEGAASGLLLNITPPKE